ncbi:MAG: hypothetical protein JRJ85_12755 [Deltaproteobacteria bacterium]|nr:hypothetical protein [Deltaproteobacteria bacterium]
MALLDKGNGFTNLFAEVFLSELDYIKKRREDVDLDPQPVIEEHKRLSSKLLDGTETVSQDPSRVAPQTPIRPSAKSELIGLALSGGGIRSATFNLGVLQGLARRGVLRCCDFLSTVSGGGYIGACLSSLLDDTGFSVEEEKFPFRFQRKIKPDERKTVKHLREHGNFLAVKGTFLEYARMLGTFVTGLILSNLFPVSLLVFCGWGFHVLANIEDYPENIKNICFIVSLCILGLMVVIRGYGATLRREPDIQSRIRAQNLNGVLAGILVISVGTGLVILLAINWAEAKVWVVNIISGISIGSVLGLLAGLIKSKNEGLNKALSVFFRIGWILLLPILFAWMLRCLAVLKAYNEQWLFITLSVAALLFILSLLIDINRTSLHHFYRDRLSEAYIIKVDRSKNSDKRVVSNETLRLSQLHEKKNGAPYHLINTTLNVPASTDRYLRGRGADLFLFSKNYVGSEVTGYRETEKYNGGKTRLATAMAISGAAASPQMGNATNKALRFLLTLLNVRLNRWMPNPNPDITRTDKTVLWPVYLIRELLGKNKESNKLLNLSDGGSRGLPAFKEALPSYHCFGCRGRSWFFNE